MSILKETLLWKNPWSRLLAAVCSKLLVSVAGYLGQGRCGRCFRVKAADGSEMALKIVLTQCDSDGLVHACTRVEFERLVALGDQDNVVNVDEQSLCSVKEDDSLLGLGFLMRDVGSSLTREDCKSRTTLTKLITSLNALHQTFYHHGDARLFNAINVSGRIVWVDFFHSQCDELDFELKRTDMKQLIRSIYGEEKLNEQNLSRMLNEYDPFNNAHLRVIEELLH